MYTNLFFSHIFYKFLNLNLNWTAQITGLNWRKLIELLRNLKIKRRMSKKIQLFTVEDSLKSSPLCVRQWSSVFPSPPSSNPREVKKSKRTDFSLGVEDDKVSQKCTWCLLTICEAHQLFSGSMLFTSILSFSFKTCKICGKIE